MSRRVSQLKKENYCLSLNNRSGYWPWIMISFLLLASQEGVGGGFRIIEQSARGTAMGGAQVASLWDPTSIHLNPAALAFLSGTHFSFGTTVIVPDQKFTGVLPAREESKMQAQVLFPPNIYLTHRFGDSWGVGLVLDVPYASRTEWNGDWVGRRLVTKSELRVVKFTPTIGLKVSESLALGAGVHVYVPKILFEHSIPAPAGPGATPGPDAIATYEASGSAQVGLQIGFLARPIESIALGASFRSQTLLSLDDGSVHYRGTVDTLLPAGKFSTTLLSPASVQAGVGWDPTEWFHVEVDGEYTFWSALKSVDVYYLKPVDPKDVLGRNWDDTFNLRCGLELNFSDVSVRAGMRVDRTPVPDDVVTPGVPDANARAYSIGLGYRVGEGLLLDFAYETVQFEDRTVTSSALQYAGPGSRFNGIYASRTAAVALNVRYSWK